MFNKPRSARVRNLLFVALVSALYHLRRATDWVKGNAMKLTASIHLIGFAAMLVSQTVFAQAFGEYGRAVGSLPRGGITAPGAPGSGQGGVGGGGVGDLGGRGLPTRLVVAAKDAGLFPRQDEESERIAQLTVGEKLSPLVQSEGASQWYMVKTEKGIVGWVKSSDVRHEPQKK
jgi:hypothetical protein